MLRVRRSVASILLGLLVCEGLAIAAIRGDKAMYVGGSLSTIPEKKEGRLDLAGDSTFVFSWDKGKWEAPFKGITRMEYGQKAGRRVGAAIALSAVTLAGPALLFSKKRKHYVTLHVSDAGGASQAAVFELSKGTYKKTIASLEAKTGLKVEIEAEEAKKQKEKENKDKDKNKNKGKDKQKAEK